MFDLRRSLKRTAEDDVFYVVAKQRYMMMSKLRDLEKELLEDEENDVVAVAANSDWSETTIQSLFGSSTLTTSTSFLSPSPSTSTSSTSSSSLSPKQVLVEAASAMEEGDKEKACEILAGVLAGKHRVAGVIAGALLGVKFNSPEIPSPGSSVYEVPICFKLALCAANQFILEAARGEKIHIIDFNSGCWRVQYTYLVQSLSSRGKRLKITTLSECREEDEARLMSYAESVGVPVQLVFKPDLTELTRESLRCEEGEELVVSFGFYLHTVPDESVRTDNPRDALLRRVRNLRPKVVVLVENEMNVNTAPLAVRVGEVCEYYEAFFDSVGQDRLEEGRIRRMANSVACEGAERVERCEVFGKWRARFGMAGFKLLPSRPGFADSLRARVNSGTRGVMGFSVGEDSGGILFGWKGRTLAVASAWI